MATSESYLWQLAREIEPTQAQKDGAVRSHTFLRDILCTGNFASRIKRSYLSGSYARDTAIAPLDDVDIVFVIDQTKWGLYWSSYPAPEVVLESFASAIRYRYPLSSVFGQRRSVRLELYHLDIDVVPAIEGASGDNLIYIPDRGATEWIKSSPKRHAEAATAVNQSNGGRFKPLVKVLKYWNGNLPSTASLKSFMIETLATRLYRSTRLYSLEEGFLHFLDFVAFVGQASHRFRWQDTFGVRLDWLGVSIPDTAGLGTNVGAGIETERRQKFVDHAIRSRDRMLEAKNASSDMVAIRHAMSALRV